MWGIFKKKYNDILNENDNYKIVSTCKRENIEIMVISQENQVNIDYLEKTKEGYLLESDIVEFDLEKNIIYLEYDDYYKLDEKERQVLKLPKIFEGTLKIRNKGNFLNTDHGLKYIYSFIGKNNSEYISKYNGSYLYSNDEPAILSKEQYQIVKIINEYNNSDKIKSEEEQYIILNKIRELATNINVKFDKELEKLPKIDIIDFMNIDFKDRNSEYLEIVTQLKEMQSGMNEAVEKAFKDTEIVKQYYEIVVDGEKRNVVFSNEMKKILNVIKDSNSKISKEEFLEKKGLIFTDERMETENIEVLYGDRVKGIGYLAYRKSASIERKGINWFEREIPYINTSEERIKITPENLEYLKTKKEEAELKEKKVEIILNTDEGEKKLLLNSEDLNDEIKKLEDSIIKYSEFVDIDDINNMISIKENSGLDRNYIEYKNSYVEVDEDIEEVKKYRDKLQEQSKEIQKAENNLRQVLLVKNNIDDLEYKEKNIENEVISKFQRPKFLKEEIKLYDYQEESIARFQGLYKSQKANGILLSDDMGLGKTIQILTFLAWLKERNELTPSLIVVPSSLIYNWSNESDEENKRGEIQRFFEEDTFKVQVVKGRIKEKELLNLKDMDIVIMTYETLRINHLETGKIKWKVIVCDEAQKIKNPLTLITNAIKSQEAIFKIACTATPIENSLEDLWCIVDFVKPGLLLSLKEFRREYIQKNTMITEDTEDKREELKKLNERLKGNLGKYYIRRTKDVLNYDGKFPKKYLVYSPVEMSNEQRIIINKYHKMKMAGKKPIELIQSMIMACSHPNLVEENDGLRINEIEKLLKTKDILDEIKGKDEKVIIFTKYRKMQVILVNLIKKVYGFSAITINGDVETLRRKQLLDEYREQKGFNIIILSPEAAGVGLNIVEANHVIHYTRHWNPAKEDQATDRAYRIKQTKDVYVYYPIIYQERGNREEKIFNSYRDMNDYFMSYKTNLSPEENLNRIILKKKMQLEEFFLATVPDNNDENLKDFFS